MDISDLQHINIPATTALATMAMLGYMFGVLPQRRKVASSDVLHSLKKDLSRAQSAVSEMEKVVCAVRSSTAKHYARLRRFQSRISRLGTQHGEMVWQDLCREVEGILDPTLQLVSEIANAQEQIRYQSHYLMTFSEIRTDPLTGLGNRRAMDHMLSTQFSILKRYGTPFSMAIVDVDNFKDLNDERGHLHGDQMLRELTAALSDALRTVDILARYGGDELVIVMPQTDLAGAGALAERVRQKIQQTLPFTVSIGVAAASKTDIPESLFKRADAALYRAKTGGRNCICCDESPAVALLHDAGTR